MDLTRFRISKVREFLGEVLDGDRKIIEDKKPLSNLPFSVETDFSKLGRFHSKHLTRGTAMARLFANLMPYFEAGFQLHIEKGFETEKMRLGSMFFFGQLFSEGTSAGTVDLRLHELNPGVVFRTRAAPVLRAFRIAPLAVLRDADAFAFLVDDSTLFVLICNRPYPWQVDAIENSYRYVIESVQAIDQEARKPSRLRGLFK